MKTSIEKNKLNVLILGEGGELMGIVLDKHRLDTTKPLSTGSDFPLRIGLLLENKEVFDSKEINKAVGRYVVGLQTYQIIKNMEQNTLIITAFKSNTGYYTRIAGCHNLTEELDIPSTELVEVILSAIFSNPFYFKDRYDQTSYFHKIISLKHKAKDTISNLTLEDANQFLVYKKLTVFTNNSVGEELQKHWLSEFNDLLVKKHIETKTQLVLVTETEDGQASSIFINTDDLPSEIEFQNIVVKIKDFVSTTLPQKEMPVIFINHEERLNFHTIKLT